MSNHYVILTGSKNNAGDYLIKHRAKQLFKQTRPNREIIDYNAWEELTDEKLEVINQGKALILTGGPAVQENMYPKVYRLTSNLSRIKVPLLTMGVGWKSAIGDWSATFDYPMSSDTLRLFNKVKDAGYQSGVRDYHTLNALQSKGFDNFIMTGCPALYDAQHLALPIENEKKLDNISFSVGVTFAYSKRMEKSLKSVIEATQELFAGKNLTAVFHHSLDEKMYSNAYGTVNPLFKAQMQLTKWLAQKGINHIDIAGGTNKLIAHYSQSDFHIGYRVHAHIFMSSISKPSVLIAEDGRGKALRNVLNGLIFDGYEKTYSFNTFVDKHLKKYTDLHVPNSHLAEDIVNNLRYEFERGRPRLNKTRVMIDNTFYQMKAFLEQLP